MTDELCEHCRMPPDRHLTSCPIRLERKNRTKTGAEKMLDDLARWKRQDPDVDQICSTVMSNREASSLAQLDVEVIKELHEVVSDLLEESPTITTPGDPRRAR